MPNIKTGTDIPVKPELMLRTHTMACYIALAKIFALKQLIFN